MALLQRCIVGLGQAEVKDKIHKIHVSVSVFKVGIGFRFFVSFPTRFGFSKYRYKMVPFFSILPFCLYRTDT